MSFVARAVEAALKAYLDLDPDASKSLPSISGKIIALDIKGLNIALLARPLEREIRISPHTGAEPDVVISGSPLALARLGVSQGLGARSLMDDIEIRGDAEVARLLGEVLHGVEIDWEELLAKGIGDIPAHQVGNAARRLTFELTNAGDRLRMDLSEYLQEEARLVPTRIEVEQFMDEIDLLREAIDRLEARVERLAGAASKS